MKNIIVLFILSLLNINSYAQKNKLIGEWISTENDILIINDTSSEIYLTSTNKLYFGKVTFGKNSFSIANKEFYFDTENQINSYLPMKDSISILEFEVTNLTDSILKISSTIFHTKDGVKKEFLQLKRREYNFDNSIKLSQIDFRVTGCLGNCPWIELVINKNRSVTLNSKFYKPNDTHSFDNLFDIDSNKTGRFAGKLNEVGYLKIESIVKTSNIKTAQLIKDTNFIFDIPTYTLKIHLENEKYEYSSYSWSLPYSLNNLYNIFYNIFDFADLKRIE